MEQKSSLQVSKFDLNRTSIDSKKSRQSNTNARTLDPSLIEKPPSLKQNSIGGTPADKNTKEAYNDLHDDMRHQYPGANQLKMSAMNKLGYSTFQNAAHVTNSKPRISRERSLNNERSFNGFMTDKKDARRASGVSLHQSQDMNDAKSHRSQSMSSQ